MIEVLQKDQLWTKEFILATIVNFALVLSMYSLLVTLAQYTIATYNTSMSIAGLVSSIFIIGVLIGRLYAGWKVNTLGAKKILISGVIIFILMSLLYFIPLNIYALILVRLIQGVGFGLGTNATGTVVSQIIPRSRSGEGIGIFSISVVLSAAIGPLIGTVLINVYGYHAIFIFSLIVGVFSLILSFFIISPKVDTAAGENTNAFKLENLIEIRVVPIATVILFGALAFSGILSFITTYANEIRLEKIGGYFFLAYSLIILITRPITGRLMDLKGENVIVYPVLITYAIGMLVLSQTTSGIMFILAAILIGLGYGNLQSITQAIAIKVTPVERMGLANSTYFIFLDLALGIGPFLLGYIIPVIGFRYMYLSFVIVILLNGFVYYFVYGRKKKAAPLKEQSF